MMPKYFPVTSHTRYVGPGSTFVAIQGYKEDGLAYLSQALDNGATTLVVHHDACISAELLAHINASGVVLERVSDTRRALAELSAQAAGFPANKLTIIGVTGTKGKTSTTFLLEHIFRSAGLTTALLGTIKNSINGVDVSAELTTPQPDYLHQFLRACVERQVDVVIMEVAAQAFSLYRVHGISFAWGVFTNFSQEHGEFYTTMDRYFEAKKQILHHIAPSGALLVNADDSWCTQLIGLPQVQPFSRSGQPSSITACADVLYNGSNYHFSCPALLGSFNSYNLLAAVSVALAYGIKPDAIQTALHNFSGVPGRLERHVLPNGAVAVIDYAHNPSSFQAVLSTLRAITPHLVVVFGCGGDRDAAKRPVMGALAVAYADTVIVTTDNPRSEDPASIERAIMAGVDAAQCGKVVCEPDRAVAIKKAYALSQPTSIIAFLGKGPDEYQQIGAIKYPFSEKAILKEL